MFAVRKRRTAEHIRADIAVRYVELLCARAGYVTSVPRQGGDYGIDIEIETFDERGFVESEEIKIQVKAAKRLARKANGREFAIRLDQRDLHHWLGGVLPVILVIYDQSRDRAYWSYIQRYFESHPKLSLKSQARKRTIGVKQSDLLTVRAIHRFARWKNEIVREANEAVKHA